ncbi:MAG: hypothetical protein KAG96_08220 [Ichthyobacteriaceae bacterium]|nr:hypothetical protein [Ichthyobacteriaceae bacterium]
MKILKPKILVQKKIALKILNLKIAKLTTFIVLLFIGNIAISQTVDVDGFVRSYGGVTYKDGDFAILQQTLNLNFEKRGEKIAFKANPLVYFYNADSLNIGMREIYMDMYFDNFDIRIGKQQVVWGKADGVFITDVVSPLNLSEFLLPDFDEIRTGVIAAKLNYYIGDGSLEAIVIPQFTPTVRPDANSIWYVQPDFPVQPTFNWSESKVKPSIENSELFLKYSAMTSFLDFEVMGGYTWDDNPMMHVEKVIDKSTGKPVLSGLNITPKHHRLTVAGASFSTDIKGVILRGEGAFYNGKYYQTTDVKAIDATVQKNYINYVAGVDFNIGNVKLSTQFIQKIILNHDDLMIENKTNNTATFMARYSALRETLHFELFSYVGIDNEDALIRPKVTYDYDDSFSVLLGGNVFVGNEEGSFGQYSDNSMVYSKFKYNF